MTRLVGFLRPAVVIAWAVVVVLLLPSRAWSTTEQPTPPAVDPVMVTEGPLPDPDDVTVTEVVVATHHPDPVVVTAEPGVSPELEAAVVEGMGQLVLAAGAVTFLVSAAVVAGWGGRRD